jgi:uncharacterized repeat protein (TIGR01451 family)
MTITKVVRFLVPALFLLALASSSSAQVASKLINDEEPLGPPGDIVGSLGNPAANHAGGFAVGLSTTGSATLSHVWGSPDGIAPPVILRTEGTFGPLVQTSFESFYGIADAGQVGYSASGTGGPDGAFDSVWVDDTSVAVEGDPMPPGPLQDLFWSFASRPSITAGGVIHFVGGTRTTVGGTTSARGLFNNTGTPLLYSGDVVPGLPAPLDDSGSPISFDYRVSASATNYIAEVEMETDGTGLTTADDGAVVFSGSALMVGGSIVQEAQPVPAAIGGEPGENWDNFDFMGVTEAGQYLFTGDTDAATTMDEIVVVGGMIVAREGQLLDGLEISGAIEGGYMNENGDWAVTWDYNDPVEGNREALFLNGELVIKELDEVDFDGDGLVDAGAILNDFTGTSTLVISDRAGGEVSIYFTANVDDNGAGNLEGFYRINVPVGAGADGDLSLAVTDTPDPVPTVGDPITYSVIVTNLSPNPATNVVVTSTLDPNVVFNAAASDPIAVHDGSPTGGVVTATIGNMAADEIQAFNIVVDTTQLGTVTTTHVVSGDEPDPIPGNNTVVSTTDVVTITDLALSLSDDPDPVNTPGGAITYTVDVSNGGPSDATGVSVTMNLDGTSIFNAGASDPIAIHDGSPTGGVVTAAIGNLASGANTSFDVVVNVTVQGTLTADATVTGNEPDPDGANNTDVEDTLFELVADVAISITDSPDPVLAAGGQITYAVNVSNAGSSDATAVVATVNLDPTTTFVSADPPASHSGGVVTANLGAMAAGTDQTFNIVVDTTVDARVVVTGLVVNSGPQSDPDPSNNGTVVNTLVVSDLSCLPVGIFSDLEESATSNVPGVAGAKFSSFFRPYRSPDGTSWTINADTDLASTLDDMVIVKKVGLPAEVTVQEGVTQLELGDFVGPVDSHLSINDAGQFAFATNTDAVTSSDEVIAKWDGLSFVTVAREGDPAAIDTYGSIIATPNIVADGTVWFDADTTGSTTTDRIIVSDDGLTIVLQEGVDFPANQDGGATFPWDNFDSNDLFVDATGANYVLTGDTENSTTSLDDIFAVNNSVVVQEGVILAGSGYTSPADATSPVEFGTITAAGDWFARGGNDDDHDWLLLNGALFTELGAPIILGSSELFDDAAFAATFFIATSNNAGDVLVGGSTNAGEDAANAVLVLNGQVVARENDPVDIDGNGVFDDGVRIRTFGNDDAVLTEDKKLVFVVTLRADGGDGSSPSIGDALLLLDPLCSEPAVCGDGILDDGEECDDGNTVSGDCCTPTCTIEPAGTVCRAAGGECDLEETCDGLSGICPADLLSTDVCRPVVDECDIEEVCDGTSVECPPDETIPGCTICGNGIVEGDEECDDGNNDNGDGCDENCVVEMEVPAVSTWGIVILTLAMGLLLAGQLYRRRFRHE